MVRAAEALAALATNIVVALPATREGLGAIRHCAAQGISVQLLGYRSPSDVELGARAGAQWFTPALGTAIGPADLIELVRVAVGSRRTFHRATSVLIGPLRMLNQAVEAGFAGADAASVTFPALARLRATARA
jgi:hypothetical protein